MTPSPDPLEAQCGFYKSTKLMQLLVIGGVSAKWFAQVEHRGSDQMESVTGTMVHHSMT